MPGKNAKMNVRHDHIEKYIGVHGEVTVQEIANHFQVSLMTVRRDLMILEEAGRIRRTHGGAILSKPGIVEFSFTERFEQQSHEKHAIGHAVSRLIQPGSTVAIDNGSTALAVAEELTKAFSGKPLTILTCSLAIASVLYAHDNIELVFLGGMPRKGSPDLVGWLTEENLKQFHVDYAIIGADGVTPDGAYARVIELTRICQAILKSGNTSILAVDHSKIGQPSFSRYASLKQIDYLVTDSLVNEKNRQWLKQLVRNVIYVAE